MTTIQPLSPDRLYRPYDVEHFTFTTTAGLDDPTGGIGADYPVVCSYLNEVQQNVIESMEEFRRPKEAMSGLATHTSELPNFSRFLKTEGLDRVLDEIECPIVLTG